MYRAIIRGKFASLELEVQCDDKHLAQTLHAPIK
uniref:Uncharacterized protein n=1 Tax=Rhizophora mucronata TaxID=61149 RepID=A0A2P2R253_RHIMU